MPRRPTPWQRAQRQRLEDRKTPKEPEPNAEPDTEPAEPKDRLSETYRQGMKIAGEIRQMMAKSAEERRPTRRPLPRIRR